MSVRSITTIVIASLIAVISITGVIFAVVHNSRQTLNGTAVCWNEVQENHFVANYEISQCENPQQIILNKNRVPFGITVDEKSAENEVEKALRDFNTIAGIEILRMGGDDLKVLWNGDVPSNKYSATCRHTKVNNIIKGVIAIKDTSSLAGTRSLLLHEYGHFLGLEHGTDIDQVMYPTTYINPNKWGFLSDSNKNLLKKRYGYEH
jgi:hypothetical protein